MKRENNEDKESLSGEEDENNDGPDNQTKDDNDFHAYQNSNIKKLIWT